MNLATISVIAMLAMVSLRSPAFSQVDTIPSPAGDTTGPVDTALKAALQAIRPPLGSARFIGAMGFLDYSTATSPTPASAVAPAALFSFAGAGAEPREAIFSGQSRGRHIELDWNFLASLRDGVEVRAMIPLFDGEQRELIFVHSDYKTPTRSPHPSCRKENKCSGDSSPRKRRDRDRGDFAFLHCRQGLKAGRCGGPITHPPHSGRVKQLPAKGTSACSLAADA